MFSVYAHVSSLEGRDFCTCLHTYTHTHTHTLIHTCTHAVSQQAESTLYHKKSILKKFTLLLQNTYTCFLTILLHYHLAGNLVLINFQNVINYVKIIMYIQCSMLTWYKILVILFIV